MASRRESPKVFVGNIPYDAKEDELRKWFSQVGPVVSFNLLKDKEQAHRGFGFCEYMDAATAQNAIRTLHGKSFNGRALRVNDANEGEGRGGESHSMPLESTQAQAIDNVYNRMTPAQVIELVEEMQKVIRSDPNHARAILHRHPNLSLAFIIAQERLKAFNPDPLPPQQPVFTAPPSSSSFPPHGMPGGAPPQFQGMPIAHMSQFRDHHGQLPPPAMNRQPNPADQGIPPRGPPLGAPPHMERRFIPEIEGIVSKYPLLAPLFMEHPQINNPQMATLIKVLPSMNDQKISELRAKIPPNLVDILLHLRSKMI